MEKQLKIYFTGYTDLRTYLLAALFVIGNIVFPQMCHQMALGGPTWLPIYFFTLIGAYKYGSKVGLLTAIISPVANSLLFGMPLLSSVSIITVKSVLLAICASWVAYRFDKVSIFILSIVVLSYQIIGSLIEWMIVRDFHTAIQDFRIGIPGMVVQVIAGWYMIRFIMKK